MKNTKKKKKKYTAMQIAPFLLLMALGVAVGFYAGREAGGIFGSEATMPDKLLQMAVFLGSIVLALYLQIIIHELGHLVFGLITGYRFASFRVGSLMLVKQQDGLKVKRFSLMGTGGQCLMAPPEMQNGHIPYLLYLMGGTIFNLIFAAVFYGLYLLTSSVAVVGTVFMLTAVVGVAFAIMNGIPLRLGAVDNDGHNAISLRKDPEGLRCFWLQFKVNEMLSGGMRLKDMPESWFEVPSETALKSPLCAAIGVFAVNRAMDQMNFDGAMRQADKLLGAQTGLIGIHRGILTAERIHCELVTKNRKGTLETLYTKEFQKFLAAMATNPSVLRMRHAYELLANRDEAAADRFRKLFDKVAHTYPHACEIEGERELMAHAYAIYRLCEGEAESI